MRPFYGLLSSGITSALVGPSGSIDWLPAPRFDSDTVFGRILDPHGGGYLSIEPDEPYSTEQSYLGDTLTVETRFVTDKGTARVRTWLGMGSRTTVWFAIDTPVPLRLTCRPTFNFGAVRPAYRLYADGVLFTNPRGPERARLTINGHRQTTDRVEQWILEPGAASVAFRFSPGTDGDTRWLSAPIPADLDRILERNAIYWRSTLMPYAGPFTDAFKRSLLVVRGLTFRPSGAPVAAATTSLPETPGGDRQWDYRYSWVRDSAYAGEALLLAGDRVAARRIAEFLLNCVELSDRPFPSPFFRVDGSLPGSEQSLLWLQGYENSRPARAGNAASRQSQLDLAGDCLWLVYRYWEESHDDPWVQSFWWAISAVAEWAGRSWNQPDASLWEFRHIRDRHTHSRLLCWVALESAAHLAESVMHDTAAQARWSAGAALIRKTLIAEAEHRGSFPQRSQGGVPDAALLTLALYGFIDARHPLFQATLKEVEHHLFSDGFVHRYRADDLGPAHYPFLLAGFWLARVLYRLGEVDRADHVIARHLDLATPLGLFGEHADPETTAVRGNFPQLFSHAALVATLAERQLCLSGRGFPDQATLWHGTLPTEAPVEPKS